MINRENWLVVKEYLGYLENVLQREGKTVKRRYDQLMHLLEWADKIPFEAARNIIPTFPVYLLTSRRDGKEKSLSPETMTSTCSAVRAFFEWARRSYPRRYAKLDVSWIDTIRPARARGIQSIVKVHKFYSLDEMRKIYELKPESLLEERDRAAMAFLFLSAMRVDAFVSLPISCVNLETATIDQLPGMGVRTKNHKAAQTYLLQIPELLRIVREWDDKVRSQLPESAMWYSAIDRTGENLVALVDPKEGRREKVVDGMERICAKLGIEYKSPHKLRHGHIVYAERMARTVEDLKAVSINVMHESIVTTEKIYGQLSGSDVRDVILRLQAKPRSEPVNAELAALAPLAKILKEHPELLDALAGSNLKEK